MLFKKLEGDNAIIISNGMYRQCDLYVRNGELFAAIGNAFIRLNADGATSSTKHRLETLSYKGNLYSSKLGRLLIDKQEGCKPIMMSNEGKLLK